MLNWLLTNPKLPFHFASHFYFLRFIHKQKATFPICVFPWSEESTGNELVGLCWPELGDQCTSWCPAPSLSLGWYGDLCYHLAFYFSKIGKPSATALLKSTCIYFFHVWPPMCLLCSLLLLFPFISGADLPCQTLHFNQKSSLVSFLYPTYPRP